MPTKRGKKGNGKVMKRIAAINNKTSKSRKSEKFSFSFISPYKNPIDYVDVHLEFSGV